jgi:serine/threonine-protein kinase
MTTHASSEKLLRLPDAVVSLARDDTRGLSAEILGRSARRLRILALMYAFTFLMAGYVPNLLFADARAMMLSSTVYWLPGVLAMVMALVVAALTVYANLPLTSLMNIGLVFLVLSNFGIAIAEYVHLAHLRRDAWLGLSWVAVWTPLFTVVIPNRPSKSLIATIASVSSVPLVIAFMVLSGRTQLQLTPAQFFFGVVFPYILIVALAYAGQRVVYALGKEVTRAQELGSYRLIERLGKGGMGEVWRAKHRLLARPAAIKLLQSSVGEGADADMAMRRFEREAQVTSQLRSPHTVELWDFGVAGDGRFYYVMELLEGLDLDTLVKRHGPISAERTIFLLRQVCHSLTEAETHGLVHRDIKPANILVCRYAGEHDFVKVLDFGIVKVTHPGTREAIVTQENVLRGTPAFIAPELVLSAGDIDCRADIYSVGCVAYWLLTGDLVFRGDTPIAVMMHHAHTPPVPVSERSELSIPPELDRVILSCLEKDPARRPQSARELSRLLAEVPVATPWTEERAEVWWSRHEPVVSTAADN